MKKLLAIMIVCVMALSLLAGCGAKEKGGAESGSEKSETFETIGDIQDFEDSSFSYNDKKFVFVFTKDGVTYRVNCDMPEDISKEINELDVSDEDFAEKAKETAASLKISKLENLNEGVPSQEELDKLIGKTGQELIDDGWNAWASEYETMEFQMYHGPYNFKVVFDGKIEPSEDADNNELILPLKVKSVKYAGIGDAATIDE